MYLSSGQIRSSSVEWLALWDFSKLKKLIFQINDPFGQFSSAWLWRAWRNKSYCKSLWNCAELFFSIRTTFPARGVAARRVFQLPRLPPREACWYFQLLQKSSICTEKNLGKTWRVQKKISQLAWWLVFVSRHRRLRLSVLELVNWLFVTKTVLQRWLSWYCCMWPIF